MRIITSMGILCVTDMLCGDMTAERMELKAKIEAENRRKHAWNPVYKVACLCGLV